MSYGGVIYCWISYRMDEATGNWNRECSRGDRLFAVCVMALIASYDVFRIGRLDGDRRRRGILITSIVSLASLHSLMRTSEQKRELIGELETRMKNDGRRKWKTRVVPKISKYQKPHDFGNISTRRRISRNIPRCFRRRSFVDDYCFAQVKFRMRIKWIYNEAIK